MLTDKQETFVLELISGKSQRTAYQTAYNTTGMKDKTIDEKASRLFARDKVRARYEELQARLREQRAAEAIASAVDVLRELTCIAFGNKQYPAYDMYGNEIQITPSIPQRQKALEVLAKYHGLMTDKVEHSGKLEVQQDKLSKILEQMQK